MRRNDLKVGIRIAPVLAHQARPDSVASVALQAEQLGYHSIWVSDHVILPARVESFYPYAPDNRWHRPVETNWLDPLVTLGWAGAAAPSLKLGTSVLVLPLRSPLVLAKQISTLDYLSGGRVILGVGIGWMREEFDLLGTPFLKRAKRAAEMVELMRQLWKGETTDFRGEFWQISGCTMYPRPAQPRIPVLWGGHSSAALRRAVTMGDGWHPTRITIQELTHGVMQLQQLCDLCGRDPASLQIVYSIGQVRPLDKDILEELHALGIKHIVVDVQPKTPDLRCCFEYMHQVAEVCGLEQRH